jgi:hypothetical protein
LMLSMALEYCMTVAIEGRIKKPIINGSVLLLLSPNLKSILLIPLD